MSLVFDSSALLAYVFNENGSEVVEELLDEADVPKYAHALNLCEVFYRVRLKKDGAAALQALKTLRDAGIEERNDLDAALWQDAGKLIALQRASNHGLALGDAFSIALARRLDADIITCDRAEFAPIAAASLANVIFIR